jgi:hypothetical protein
MAVFIHCMGVLTFEHYDFCVHIFCFILMSNDVMSEPGLEGGGERLGTQDHGCIADSHMDLANVKTLQPGSMSTNM